MDHGSPHGASDGAHVDYDAVCQKVRAAADPARVRGVSLHDERGEVLWLTESSMGPDEHAVVSAGLAAFRKPGAPPIFLSDLGDSGYAVLLRAVSAERQLVGAILLVLDTRSVKDPRPLLRGMTGKLHRALREFAAMRPIRPDVLQPARLGGSGPNRAVTTVSRASRAPLKAPARPASATPPGVSSADAPPTAADADATPTAAAAESASKAPSTAAHAPASAGASASASTPSAAQAPTDASDSAPAARRRAKPAAAAPVPTSRRPAGAASKGGVSAASGAASRAAGKSASTAAPAARAPTGAAPSGPPRSGSAPSGRAPSGAASTTPTVSPKPRHPSAPARPSPPTLAAVPLVGARQTAGAGNLHPREIPPEIDRLHAALRRTPFLLHAQRLVPLTKGTHFDRYEILLRTQSEEAPNAAPKALLKAAIEHGLGSMIDRRVVTELVGFLVRHPGIWKGAPVQFSVNLTATALHDEHFIKFVGMCLAKSNLPKSMIAFEVDASTAIKLAHKMTGIGNSLHRLGCPLVLDDFSLRTEALSLLRLPGVHYVKLAPEITTKMRSDKLAQAAITAVVQMARVLGMHTVAKHAETTSEQEWFTALGVDLVQSRTLSPPGPLEALSTPR